MRSRIQERLYDEVDNQEIQEALLMREFGDYTYMFNDYELDFSDDDDWNEISKDGSMKYG